jgi:ligand-binding sensor domain-containing protein
MRLLLVTAILVTVLCARLDAQTVRDWKLYLAGNEVNEIVERNGIVWFATSRGLVRLDRATGEKEFYEEGTSGPPEHPVNGIAVDSAGGLWTAWGYIEHGGVSSQIAGVWTAQPRSGVRSRFDTPTDVEIAPTGEVWCSAAAVGSVARLDPGRWQSFYSAQGDLPNYVEGLTFDARGRLWATFTRTIGRLNGNIWTMVGAPLLPTTQIREVAPDRSGGLWVAAYMGLVHLRDSSSTVVGADESMLGDDVKCVTVDRRGDVWAASDSGLVRYDGVNWTRVLDADDLPIRARVKTLASSTDGVWLGTYTGGAYHIDAAGAFEAVSTAKTPIPSDNITALVTDRSGALWVAAASKLYRFDGSTWTVLERATPEIEFGQIIDATLDAEGRLWFLSNAEGILLYDGSTWRRWSAEELGMTMYLGGGIVAARDGRIWAAGNIVVDYDGSSWTSHLLGGSDRFDTSATEIAVDSAGGIWVGTAGLGLARYDGSTWTRSKPFNDLVSDIAVDATGRVWASSREELARYDAGAWTVLKTSDRTLPESHIVQIVATPSGRLWFGIINGGADAGLLEFEDGVWTSFRRSTTLMPDVDVSAIAFSPPNTLWVGTRGGLVALTISEPAHAPVMTSGAGATTAMAIRPNPANGEMTIDLDLAAAAHVTLSLHDGLGRRVATIYDAPLERGPHAIDARIDALPAGIYHCRMLVDGEAASTTVVVRSVMRHLISGVLQRARTVVPTGPFLRNDRRMR